MVLVSSSAYKPALPPEPSRLFISYLNLGATMASTPSFADLPSTAKGTFTPFKVNIPDKELSDLKTLLNHSHLGPQTYENGLSDLKLGIDYAWMETAVEMWKTEFDWYVPSLGASRIAV
jgi:Epoxide hydrolase N terminus